VVAAGGNQWQIGSVPKPRKQAKTVAVRCDQLPESTVRVAETLRANGFAEPEIVTQAANLVCCVARPR
jgi:hypothetical protein